MVGGLQRQGGLCCSVRHWRTVRRRKVGRCTLRQHALLLFKDWVRTPHAALRRRPERSVGQGPQRDKAHVRPGRIVHPRPAAGRRRRHGSGIRWGALRGGLRSGGRSLCRRGWRPSCRANRDGERSLDSRRWQRRRRRLGRRLVQRRCLKAGSRRSTGGVRLKRRSRRLRAPGRSGRWGSMDWLILPWVLPGGAGPGSMRRQRRRRHGRVGCVTRRTGRAKARRMSCRDLSRESLRWSRPRGCRCTAGPLSGPKKSNPMGARPGMLSPRKLRRQDLAAGPAATLGAQGAPLQPPRWAWAQG